MKLVRLFAVLVLAALSFAPFTAPEASAEGCPLIRYCFWDVDLGCSCDLIYCNGQYHCGRVVE
jgi:hypothetical protein